MARKHKTEPEELSADPGTATTAEAPIPQEIIDVIPGDAFTFSGWDDPDIIDLQAGWPEKTGTRELEVSLTDTEIIAASDERLQAEDDLARVEAEATAAKAHFKARMETLDGEISRLRCILRSKKEARSVPVRWLYGLRSGSDGRPLVDPNARTLLRTDTMQPVTVDTISDEDRQMALAFGDEPQPADKPDTDTETND